MFRKLKMCNFYALKVAQGNPIIYVLIVLLDPLVSAKKRCLFFNERLTKFRAFRPPPPHLRFKPNCYFIGVRKELHT